MLSTTPMPPFTLTAIHQMDADAFVTHFGPVFEHSPWVARRAFTLRPFADLQDLHQKMCQTLAQATPEEQLDLIIAHPDLGDRLAPLTSASTSEQTAAGLHTLTPEEVQTFQSRNAAYKARFGFPFILCARLNDKSKMLAAFTQRLENNRTEEISTALGQIELIALLRLQALITTPSPTTP